MASNSFGNIFKIMTWGESHGKAIGVVIDGCPAGLYLDVSDIQRELFFRRPGMSEFTSPRSEEDQAEILSGVFEGKTTGMPISIMIHNQDRDSSRYEGLKEVLRPGHANFTYLEKYKIFDYRGSGRASARETACRVAAGAVAKKLLDHYGIEIVAYIHEIGGVAISKVPISKETIQKNPIFCPDEAASIQMREKIKACKEEGDSLGGVIECVSVGLPTGLGDPIYEKLHANLAKAIFTIPAVKAFSMGSGFAAARMKGSEHNDIFVKKQKVETKTNYSGGVLGGISNGMPLIFQTTLKPPASIMKKQETLTTDEEKTTYTLPSHAKMDPCVAIRAVPVVEAMTALVLVDALLMNRLSIL